MSGPDYWANIKANLGEWGFSVTPLAENETAWKLALDKADYVPVAYTPGMIRYQHAYHRPLASEYQALDMILGCNGQAVAIWPMALMRGIDGRANVSSHTGSLPAVLPPLFVVDIGEKSTKRLISGCIKAVETIVSHGGVKEIGTSYSLRQSSLPLWHRLWIERGALTDLGHELWVDLTLPLDVIRSGIRKSYKSLISKARNSWQIEIDHAGDATLFERFRLFHARVAGRVTRSLESWELQLKAVRSGEAFCVYLFDEVQQLIGSSLYHVSRDEAVYAVGAYDRSRFDQPIAHLSMMLAIEEAQASGKKAFKIGSRPYPQDIPPPSEKELSIAYFKEGFATDFGIEMRLTLPLERNEYPDTSSRPPEK